MWIQEVLLEIGVPAAWGLLSPLQKVSRMASMLCLEMRRKLLLGTCLLYTSDAADE